MGVIFTLFSGSLNGHDCDSSDNPSIEVSSRPSGSYTDKNSEEYKNAKGIFNTLTKEVGFSGAGAAGEILLVNLVLDYTILMPVEVLMAYFSGPVGAIPLMVRVLRRKDRSKLEMCRL